MLHCTEKISGCLKSENTKISDGGISHSHYAGTKIQLGLEGTG